MSWIITLLFGCTHRHCSFPMTAMKTGHDRSYARTPTTTYVVCLDCGKEFPYDWEQMKLCSSAKHVA